MTKTPEKTDSGRRNFLKLATTAAPAAVAATVISGTEAEAVEARGTGSGLKDTEHTRAYYNSARF